MEAWGLYRVQAPPRSIEADITLEERGEFTKLTTVQTKIRKEIIIIKIKSITTNSQNRRTGE